MISKNNTTTSHIILKPYEGLAAIYDRLMSHVEYDKWAEFILSLLCRGGNFPSEALELACGTGNMANHLAASGIQVTGYDRSPQMIEQAKDKYRSPNLRFQAAAFDDFPLEKQYDAVICLYDSINYILEFDALVSFIERVKRVLHSGGIFIFDICTRYNSYTNFRGYTDEGYIDGCYYHRTSDYNPKNHLHANDFIICPANDSNKRFAERHEQNIYSVRQIRSAIKRAGMILESKFDDICLRSARRRSLRIHFLTRKP